MFCACQDMGKVSRPVSEGPMLYKWHEIGPELLWRSSGISLSFSDHSSLSALKLNMLSYSSLKFQSRKPEKGYVVCNDSLERCCYCCSCCYCWEDNLWESALSFHHVDLDELGSSGLVSSTFTRWSISPALTALSEEAVEWCLSSSSELEFQLWSIATFRGRCHSVTPSWSHLWSGEFPGDSFNSLYMPITFSTVFLFGPH